MELESITKITELRRVSHENVRHKLERHRNHRAVHDLCGGEDYNDTEAFGRKREEFLRKFLELPTGIPDSDTFRHLFERLDPTEFSVCLYDRSGFYE